MEQGSLKRKIIDRWLSDQCSESKMDGYRPSWDTQVMELSTQKTIKKYALPLLSMRLMGNPSSWATWLSCQSWILPSRTFKFTQLSRWGGLTTLSFLRAFNPQSYKSQPRYCPGVTSYNWQEDSKSFYCLPSFERRRQADHYVSHLVKFCETKLKLMRWSSTRYSVDYSCHFTKPYVCILP